MTGGPLRRREVLGLGAAGLVSAGLGATGCSTASRPGAGGATGGSGEPEVLRYGDDDSQVAELHRPSGSSRGTVVVIHGGFWLTTYDRSLGYPLAQDLAGRGWTALNIEYRRVGGGGGGGGGVPETLDDVSAAVDLLAAHDVGTDVVVALGHSAGGQLAAWAGGRQRLDRWSGAAVAVTHVVPQAGVLDLRTGADEDLGGGAVREFLGGTPLERPDSYALADPLVQVPLDVPVRCVHGEDDGTVPIAQSEAYVAAARAAGADADLIRVPGDHLGLIDVDGDAWARTLEVLDDLVPPTR